MATCPFCGAENIEGADLCEQCHESITFLTKPRPASPTEYSLVKGRVETLVSGKPPIVVEPTTRVADVLRLLVDRSVGCVVVVERGSTGDAGQERVVGIFSERDALIRLNTEAAQLGDRPISEFMTAPAETLEADACIAFALHKMDLGGYRHMPVVTEGRVTGVISIRDILRYITDSLVAGDRP